MAGYVCDPGELMSPSSYLGGSQATAGSPDVDTGEIRPKEDKLLHPARIQA